jgi:dTDP-4-amino-4,6-dideoxygalactose transaminase
LRAHGAKPKYHHKLVGGNFRLDALQAALLAAKLPNLASYEEARRANAAFYDREFASLSPLLVAPASTRGHVYNQYVVRTPQRDALRAALTAARIGSEIYYPRCLHQQECFRELGYRDGAFPEAERAADEVLALPVYPELSRGQRAYVAERVTAFVR